MANQAEGEQNPMAAVFARCFRGADGQMALKHLQGLTIDRRPPPSISEAELRHLEGQRYLVSYIQSLVDRGMNP